MNKRRWFWCESCGCRVARSPDGAHLDPFRCESCIQPVRCECGETCDEPCSWEGNTASTVIVQWMPFHLRDSHVAACNRGVYPLNGAVRIRCEKSCASKLLERDGEWSEIVADGGSR